MLTIEAAISSSDKFFEKGFLLYQQFFPQILRDSRCILGTLNFSTKSISGEYEETSGRSYLVNNIGDLDYVHPHHVIYCRQAAYLYEEDLMRAYVTHSLTLPLFRYTLIST